MFFVRFLFNVIKPKIIVVGYCLGTIIACTVWKTWTMWCKGTLQVGKKNCNISQRPKLILEINH